MKYEEEWKPIKFLASEELRKKIRRIAKKNGLNMAEFMREIMERETE